MSWIQWFHSLPCLSVASAVLGLKLSYFGKLLLVFTIHVISEFRFEQFEVVGDLNNYLKRTKFNISLVKYLKFLWLLCGKKLNDNEIIHRGKFQLLVSANFLLVLATFLYFYWDLPLGYLLMQYLVFLSFSLFWDKFKVPDSLYWLYFLSSPSLV